MDRREYKTRWEAAKRKRIRERGVHPVELDIPLPLAKKLWAEKPYGWSFKQFLVRRLQISVGGPLIAVPKRPVGPVRSENKIGRNEPCFCGSGRKFKLCCGRFMTKEVARQ